jgi:hypothetical protein
VGRDCAQDRAADPDYEESNPGALWMEYSRLSTRRCAKRIATGKHGVYSRQASSALQYISEEEIFVALDGCGHDGRGHVQRNHDIQCRIIST